MIPTRRVAAAAALSLAALLQGCASHPEVPAADAGRAGRNVIDAPRSARGNPPFYEVFGVRYHVLDSSKGYRESGIASWYGKDFHKLPTSSGEPYDMYEMTAAHKTLPLPTWVEVRNLANGKKVIVKVNDRGPFVGDRIIDLSFSAAEALDMIRDGTARVEVRALGAPAGASVPPPPLQADAESGRGGGGFSLISEAAAGTLEPGDRLPQQMFIQVGAFSEHGNAVKLVDRLKGRGFANAFVVSDFQPENALHRVRVGPLGDAQEYDRVNDDLRRLGVGETHLVVDY